MIDSMIGSMKVEGIPAVCRRIYEVDGLDPITVLWLDYKPGVGEVIISCYGQAWTAYFNAMGGTSTIREFFAEAPADYLANALGSKPRLSLVPLMDQVAYLQRIIGVVKASLAAHEVPGCIS